MVLPVSDLGPFVLVDHPRAGAPVAVGVRRVAADRVRGHPGEGVRR